MDRSRATWLRVFLALLLATLLFSPPAHADRVDDLVAQLRTSRDYKVRLSAALNLAKLGDKRAKTVVAFIAALEDRDETVRGVAAAALGKLLDSTTDAALLEAAKRSLVAVAAGDKSPFVRRQAKKAGDALSRLLAVTPHPSVYVELHMAVTATGDRALRSVMRGAAEKQLTRRDMLTQWPGAQSPTPRDLRQKRAKAFHVGATLTQLQSVARGSQTDVSCQVKMYLATYPERSMFAFLDGGAKVTTPSSARQVQLAKEDCVAAVVEDLVGRQVIPTIESKTRRE